MKIIDLDLTNAKTLSELHEIIKIAFDFPEWYGKNWDAFWDLLRSESDADMVIISGENTLSKDFEKHIIKIHEILERKIEFNKECNFNDFSYRIIS